MNPPSTQNTAPLACWTFQEPPGEPRVSAGRHRYALQEHCGPLERADEGPGGLAHSLRLRRGQWLRLPRDHGPGLNLTGRQPLTLVAWIKREADYPWQFIAGMWDERDRRQYGLFVNGTKQYDSVRDARKPAADQVHAYLSDTGGKSPGKEACFSYATGATRLELHRWYCLASVWDGRQLSAYIDGRLDANGPCNPIPFTAPIFNPDARCGESADARWADLPGADFTVGQHGHVAWPDYPAGSGPAHEGFEGLIGPLALFDRTLPPGELNPETLLKQLSTYKTQ